MWLILYFYGILFPLSVSAPFASMVGLWSAGTSCRVFPMDLALRKLVHAQCLCHFRLSRRSALSKPLTSQKCALSAVSSVSDPHLILTGEKDIFACR